MINSDLKRLLKAFLRAIALIGSVSCFCLGLGFLMKKAEWAVWLLIAVGGLCSLIAIFYEDLKNKEQK